MTRELHAVATPDGGARVFDFVDSTLKRLLETQIANLTVGFDVPNNDWRSQVATNGGNWVNVYLVELRENRKLRTNEWTEVLSGGQFVRTPAPLRLDAHYLVSAWTRAGISATPLVEATIDEAIVLYDVLRVLVNNSPLDVATVYAGATPLPPVLAERPLPMTVAPQEGFAKLPDFWNRMEWVWKPVIEVVVTLPVSSIPTAAGPTVTSVFARVMETGEPSSAEELVVLGGYVRAGSSAVAGAWVRIAELERAAVTDAMGRFFFENVPRGLYHLEARARGFAAPGVRVVEVPSPSGEYDLAIV